MKLGLSKAHLLLGPGAIGKFVADPLGLAPVGTKVVIGVIRRHRFQIDRLACQANGLPGPVVFLEEFGQVVDHFGSGMLFRHLLVSFVAPFGLGDVNLAGTDQLFAGEEREVDCAGLGGESARDFDLDGRGWLRQLGLFVEDFGVRLG